MAPSLPCFPGSAHLLDHVGGFVIALSTWLLHPFVLSQHEFLAGSRPLSNYQEIPTLASFVRGLLAIVLDLWDQLGSHLVPSTHSIHNPASMCSVGSSWASGVPDVLSGPCRPCGRPPVYTGGPIPEDGTQVSYSSGKHCMLSLLFWIVSLSVCEFQQALTDLLLLFPLAQQP